MKIKMLVSIAGHAMPEHGIEDFAFNPNQIVEVGDALAARWIAGGHAVRYEDEEPVPKSESATLGGQQTAMIDHKPATKPRQS
jgi:hypothetical protein